MSGFSGKNKLLNVSVVRVGCQCPVWGVGCGVSKMKRKTKNGVRSRENGYRRNNCKRTRRPERDRKKNSKKEISAKIKSDPLFLFFKPLPPAVNIVGLADDVMQAVQYVPHSQLTPHTYHMIICIHTLLMHAV